MHCLLLLGVLWCPILASIAITGPQLNVDGARVKREDEPPPFDAEIFTDDTEKAKQAPLDQAKIEEMSKCFSRIVGGEEAKKHEFPSIVIMVYNGQKICGGTIIGDEWVMSAAHCLHSNSPSEFKFLAGKHDKTKTESTEQEVQATKIIKHSGYSSNPINNDIALFKVSPPFKFNKYVKKGNLPKKGLNPTGNSIPVGWGATSQGGSSASLLQKVSVPILTNDRCKEKYPSDRIFPGSLCAGYDEGGKDSCQGDSGGPLYFLDKKKFVVIGITSWGTGCARPDKPGVYTRVTEYLDWITKNRKTFIRNTDGEEEVDEEVEENSDGSGGSDGGPISLSNALAQIVCKGYEENAKDKQLAPAVKTRPKTAVTCGWFTLSRCTDESVCSPFKVWSCKT